MNLGPVQADRLNFSDAAAPGSHRYGRPYSAPAVDAWPQHFLRGNQLPRRWGRRDRFSILATGFGLGSAFLATWAAWRADPSRCDRLYFIAIEPHPLCQADLREALKGCVWPELAQQLVDSWPAHTPDMHILDLEDGGIRLMLVFGPTARVLPQLVAQVDAFYLSSRSGGLGDTTLDSTILRGLHRLAAPGATLVATTPTPAERAGLLTAGFVINQAGTMDWKVEGVIADFSPRSRTLVPPGRACLIHSTVRQPVIVVGAGLAGAAVASALVRQGVAVTVLEGQSQPAQAASGQPGGLFHGVVHPQDGSHAQWLRAAALRAHAIYAPLAASGHVDGATQGLLRGEQHLSLARMRALLDSQGLPDDWMQAWSEEMSSRASGVAWHQPAWFCPQGGWVSPADLIKTWLTHDLIEWRCSRSVDRVVELDGGWQLLDGHGVELARAQAVVLAVAEDTARLLGQQPGPWHSVRGQVSLLAEQVGPDLPLPLADRGYALRLRDGRLLYGATSTLDDADPLVRTSDHESNAQTLHRLTGWRPDVDAAVQGRVGWRMQTGDRLPWIGPAPFIEAGGRRHPDQARMVVRRSGLFVLAGLGSRGLTHAPLAGELLAAWITGAPMPVLSKLIDAVDVARFAARASRINRN